MLRRLAQAAGAILCIVGVPIVVIVLVHVLFGVPLSAYRPVINDEVTYWHQASTFSHVGFAGGYYTLDEITNPSGMTPFGPHGPGFPVLYGLAGKVVGWHRHSVVLLSLIAIGLAGCLWVTMNRLSAPRLLLSGVLLVTYWHTVFWAATGMQDPLHHAGAIAMAAFFGSALGQARPSITVAGWILLVLLSFIKPSWAILLPLWAVATSHGGSTRRLLVMVGVSFVCAAAVFAAYGRTVAPYSTGFFFLRALTFSLPTDEITKNVLDNIRRLRMPDQFQPIEILHRVQYVSFLVMAVIAAVVSRSGKHFILTAAAMAIALGGMLMLYEFASFAEHRLLSAFLLFGALLCIAAPGRLGPALAVCLTVSNLAFAQVSLVNFEGGRRDHYLYDNSSVVQLGQAITGTVVFQPGASRWCNTMLTSQFPPALIAIPAGIGLSVVQKPERMGGMPKSRYLLLDDAMRAAFGDALEVQEIARLPYGVLYVNRHAACERAHARLQ